MICKTRNNWFLKRFFIKYISCAITSSAVYFFPKVYVIPNIFSRDSHCVRIVHFSLCVIQWFSSLTMQCTGMSNKVCIYTYVEFQQLSRGKLQTWTRLCLFHQYAISCVSAVPDVLLERADLHLQVAFVLRERLRLLLQRHLVTCQTLESHVTLLVLLLEPLQRALQLPVLPLAWLQRRHQLRLLFLLLLNLPPNARKLNVTTHYFINCKYMYMYTLNICAMLMICTMLFIFRKLSYLCHRWNNSSVLGLSQQRNCKTM